MAPSLNTAYGVCYSGIYMLRLEMLIQRFYMAVRRNFMCNQQKEREGRGNFFLFHFVETVFSVDEAVFEQLF